MAAFTLTNARIQLGSFPMETTTASFSVEQSVQMQDAPVYGGGGYMRRYPGLKSYTTNISGYANYDVADFGYTGDIGKYVIPSRQVITILPDQAGEMSMFTAAQVTNFAAPTGSVGDMAGFDMSFVSDTAMVNGIIAVTPRNVTASGTGSTFNIAGPEAGKSMWSALHIFYAVGAAPSVVVKIQSSATSNFASPTDRITFLAATSAGDQMSAAAGAITDAYWRAVWTLSGTVTDVGLMVSIGVA